MDLAVTLNGWRDRMEAARLCCFVSARKNLGLALWGLGGTLIFAPRMSSSGSYPTSSSTIAGFMGERNFESLGVASLSACETCSRALDSFADAAAMKSLVFWDDVCRFGEPGGLLEISVCELEASEPL
jgi:hypothetical protein